MNSIRNIYFHIPFCARICHYCDFAKTANFETSDTTDYMQKLVKNLDYWINKISLEPCESLFFGGGTPSLISEDYRPLFLRLEKYMTPTTEITLEANPLDVCAENCRIWLDLGFNRISLGIQTFSDQGLQFLTRDHSSDQAKRALSTAQEFFKNVTVDFIYGWKNQTLENWHRDLTTLQSFEVNHVSCYHLMYEPKTPLGRAYLRNPLTKTAMDSELFYKTACEVLQSQDFQHYEVSNWAKQTFQSLHNKNYWKNNFFLGIGTGAHGFIPGSKNSGERYFYHPQFRPFLSKLPEDLLTFEQNRSAKDFILEACANGMRSAQGLNVKKLETEFSVTFLPSPILEKGLMHSLLNRQGDHLVLIETEWFRENAWALEASESFVSAR